ncbi:MAG: sugar ABC transporter permease [Candidatus Bathyarchaeia archaeon]
MSALQNIKKRLSERVPLYLMLAPTLILYLIFFFYPVINGFWFSFFKWAGISPHKEFVGFKNFASLVSSSEFHMVLSNTVILTALYCAIQSTLGFAMAWLIRKYARLGSILLSIALLPIILSFVSVGLMWSWIYDPSFGLLNIILEFLGLGFLAREWVADPSIALYAILITSVWSGLGLYTVIYSAGLKTISTSIYDAIEIDGLSGFQKVRYVILPSLKDAIALVLILSSSHAFKIFDVVWVLTGGGPAFRTETLALNLYRYAFEKWQAGYACAIGVFLLLFSLPLAIIQFRFLRTKR